MSTKSFLAAISIFACLFLAPLESTAEAAAEAKQAVSLSDPSIPASELSILINPLTKDELIIEADAWRDTVKAKAEQIAQALVAAKRGDKSGEAEPINAMRAERTLLIDNLRTVVTEIEVKSDPADTAVQSQIKDYRLYMASVGGIRIDASDAASTWKAISGWLRSEQGGLRWARNFAVFFGILLLARVIAAILRRVLRRAFDKVAWPELLEDFLIKSVYWLVMLGGILMALSALEVSMGPLLAIVGAAGFIVAFAMQDSLSNFASGLMILFFRPFDVGDAVDAGGVSGVVESMNLVATTIKTFDNKKMIVPNNKILGEVITNATDVDERRVDLIFGIGYEDDADRAHAILEEIVTAHPKVLAEPVPNIRLNELADSSVNFIVRPWVKTVDYWTVYWDVMREVKSRFENEGIGIPYPQQDVHVHLVDDSVKQAALSAVAGVRNEPPSAALELDSGDH